MLELQEMQVSDVRMKNVFGVVASEYKLSKSEASEVFSQWATYERADKNLFGVVNAVTRAGQVLDNKGWVRFDEIGGSLLDVSESRWESMVARANTLTDKDFEKIYMASA